MNIEKLLSTMSKELKEYLGGTVTLYAKIYKRVTVPQLVAFGEIMIVTPDPIPDPEDSVMQWFRNIHEKNRYILFKITYSYGTHTDDYWAFCSEDVTEMDTYKKLFVYFVEYECYQLYIV